MAVRPCPTAQLTKAIGKIGRALHQIYGMTEAPWPITLLGPEDHVENGARLHSVGKATTVCQVRIASADGTQLAPK